MLRTRWMTILAVLLAGPAAAAPPAAGDAVAPDPLAASAEQIRPLLVGSTVPDVAVRTATGEPFALRTAIANKPSVVVFYRGGW